MTHPCFCLSVIPETNCLQGEDETSWVSPRQGSEFEAILIQGGFWDSETSLWTWAMKFPDSASVQQKCGALEQYELRRGDIASASGTSDTAMVAAFLFQSICCDRNG